MSKLLLILIIVGIGLLVWGGVLQVSFNSDKVGDLPGNVVEKTLSKSLYEQGRALSVKGKRKTELFFAEKDDQKMKVILGFVEKDSERLQRMMEAGRVASEVKPQAELLVDSLRQARVQSWDLSEGELADLSSNVQEVMNAALAVFHAIDTYYEGEDKEELALVTTDLADELDTAIAQEDDEAAGAVAGTEDDTREEADNKTETAPEADVPLRF